MLVYASQCLKTGCWEGYRSLEVCVCDEEGCSAELSAVHPADAVEVEHHDGEDDREEYEPDETEHVV